MLQSHLVPDKLKSILIGIDGACWELLMPWIRDERLPFLSGVYRKSRSGTLMSTVPSATCPALPSMYTGMNPGNLGIMSYMKGTEAVTMKDVEYPKLWDYLDDQGLSSVIYNVRFTYPPDKMDGVMVSGNPVPSEESPYIYPEIMKKRLGGIQRDEILLDRLLEDKKKNEPLILDKAKEITRRRYEKLLSVSLSKTDFLFYYIGNSDLVQHALWHRKKMILEFYRVVDDILKDLFERFPDIPKIIFSDHGFHKSAEYKFHVNHLLFKRGYLKREGNWLSQRFMNIGQMIARDFVSPKTLIKKMESGSVSIVGRFDNFPGIDQDDSKAWLSEPWGIRCDQEIVDEVISDLKKVRWKGEKIVKSVWRKEEVFQGKYLKDIPEVIFMTEPKFHTEAQLSSRMISKLRWNSKRKHPGEHTNAREGIYMVTPGEGKGVTMNIYDTLPLMLYLMDIPIPEGIDGGLDDSFIREREPRYERYRFAEKSSETEDLSEEEQEKVKDRLRALGYLDQ